MKENIKKSIGYGIVAFILSACYFKIITSPDWGQVNYGDGTIIIHIAGFFEAMVTGMMGLTIIAVGFKRIPSVMNIIHLGARIFVRAVALGVMSFTCWVGIGMFQFMGAPDVIINSAYRGGAMFGVMIAVIAIPFLYFWKPHVSSQ